jgi:hypothetical protein
MAFQEKRAIVSFFSTTLVSILYFAFIYQRYTEGDFTTGGELHFWASAILLFIPVQIVAKIIVQVLFIVVNLVVTRENEPKITDEFDKLVDLKATRNFYHVFAFSVFLGMGALVLSQPVTVMFTLIILGMIVGGAILDLSQFIYYRRGV